ncbi:unnamed protein product [Bursaphelenchus okinawaensis]|uniref:mitogen-activated protein kinase kinase kinase n=1 Tax=Bursaphelenchus okinawaensis TaxID=465554 RepID=A0A811JQV5_9BILA|nr:unnamed protein product [Bursaphelenchus okinawaensis]CAG9077947.1 unnamed protein product [Bursaphelenchus okinawaensis]
MEKPPAEPSAASTSTAQRAAGFHNVERQYQQTRKLQIVLVMDRKMPKYMKQRDQACADVEKVAKSLKCNLQVIEFDPLDFGETKALDTFYNADVALVDFTMTGQISSLCYHVGVRESMGQMYNIIIMYMYDETMNQRVDPLKSTLNNFQLLTYFQCQDGTLLCSDKATSGLRDFDPRSDRYQSMKSRGFQTFAEAVKTALTNVQIEANAHAKEKFLSDLRKVREMEDPNEANQFLERMRSRLDNPDVLNLDTVCQMLLSYRDTQNYDAMINLIEDLEKVNQNQIVHAQPVWFLYAFALNRRNQPGDRDKCIENVLQIMEKYKENVSPDVICLAGRVYKDRFISSNYEDKEALEKAIEWYRKAFNVSPLEYSGINLTTMLRARGEQFEHNVEMQRVAVVLNSLLGRKGALANMSEYWDVATFFEVSVLAEDYNKACQAAEKMAMLKPPTWFLKSTMENIKLISRCAASCSPIEKEKQTFVFWTEFFMEAIEGFSDTNSRFPVLIQEVNKQYTPSYMTINEHDVILTHVLEHSQAKSPPPGIHRWGFKWSQIKAFSASKRDDRSMYMYVYENSDDFNITFPSSAHCNGALSKMSEAEDGCGGKVLNDCEAHTLIDFEYEVDNKTGERVILGRGTYGVVYAARDVTTQRSIVVKEVEVKNAEEVQPLMEEIKLHSTLSHENIVQYLGSKVEKRDFRNDVFLIFMEQVPGGSLSSLLRDKWGPLDAEQTLAIYASQILQGVKYLHDQKIVHRDIKGENVLVNTYSGLCKISDFGTCKRLAGLNPCTETFKGTLQYMAPEVIDHGQRGYGAPADVWSFGCTMIEMATGKPPFVELGLPQAAMFKVGMYKTHPPIPTSLSESCTKFIKRCFEPDPNKRATAAELLLDTFLLQYIPNTQRNTSTKKRVDVARTFPNKFHRSASHMSGMIYNPMNSLNPRKETQQSHSECNVPNILEIPKDTLKPHNLEVVHSKKNRSESESHIFEHANEQFLATSVTNNAFEGGKTFTTAAKLPSQNKIERQNLRLKIERPQMQNNEIYAAAPVQNDPHNYFTRYSLQVQNPLQPPSEHEEAKPNVPSSASPSFGMVQKPAFFESTASVSLPPTNYSNSPQFMQLPSGSGFQGKMGQNSLVSQPPSPHAHHTPLTASPSLSDTSPFLQLPQTAASIQEENSLVNRFFNLQKDHERRLTLASMMGDNEDEILIKWMEHITAEVRDDEPLRITKEILRHILNAIRLYFVPTDTENLQAALAHLQKTHDEFQDPEFEKQLTDALCVFPHAVQPLLKNQGVKPHWMFTLDDLIRSAVQQALNCLKPEVTQTYWTGGSIPSVGNMQQPYSVQHAHALSQQTTLQRTQPTFSSTVNTPTTEMAEQQRFVDVSQQHRLYTEHIARLLEDLVQVERNYRDLLEQSLNEKRRSVERMVLQSDVDSGVDGRSPLEMRNEADLYAGTHQVAVEDGVDSDSELTVWLTELGCDEESIQSLIRQQYTKADLIDFVSREELLQAGVPGGTSCRIWRAILRHRLESSSKSDGEQVSRKYARYRT